MGRARHEGNGRRRRQALSLARVLVGVAAVVLLGTAAFHATGYRPLAIAVDRSNLPAFFRGAVPGIWLFFSWHLVAMAGGAAWAVLTGRATARPLLAFISVVVFVDTVFVIWIAGVFAGTILLAAAAVCLLIGTASWRGKAV